MKEIDKTNHEINDKQGLPDPFEGEIIYKHYPLSNYHPFGEWHTDGPKPFP